MKKKIRLNWYLCCTSLLHLCHGTIKSCLAFCAYVMKILCGASDKPNDVIKGRKTKYLISALTEKVAYFFKSAIHTQN